MDDLRRKAAEQEGLAARWQLKAPASNYADAADWAARDLRRVFPGVVVTGWGPITQRQLWRGATLTAPGTWLHVASAAALWEMRTETGRFVTVVRRGNRGANTSGRLRVAYSTTLVGNVTILHGIPTTTAERTLIDLWSCLGPTGRSKMLREALRRKITDPVTLLAVLQQHRGARGVARLRTEVLNRLRLPFDRCRSDGEAFGLVVLQEAGIEIPEVNETFAGQEADFCWPELMLIIEIDGPQWHRFKEEDARKTAIWSAAGYRVRRIPSDLLYADPNELLRLAPAPR